MKIMHLCTGYPLSYNGGITNYVRSLATIQYENGNDVCVVGGNDKEFKKFEYKYINYSSIIRPFTCKTRHSLCSLKKIEKILIAENPDLLHIHMMLDVDTRIFKLLKQYKIKYIISLHDYSFLCPRVQMFKDKTNCECVSEKCEKCAYFVEQSIMLDKFFNVCKLNKKIGKPHSPHFLKMFEENKKLLENAELLLPVSNRVKEIYINSNIKNNYKVVHIGNITAKTFKKYEYKEIQNDGKIKILMLGSFSYVKGGEEFLKISKNLSHEKFEFYFYGRASDEEKRKMKDNDIIDKGTYTQNNLKKILKMFDFGCVLSIWEDNAPQVVMELLNNNIPVIGTRMGGIPDFIIDGQNGFLYDPYNQESFNILIEKMEKLTKNDCEKMKSNITRTLTPAEHFEELNKLYNKVVNGI